MSWAAGTWSLCLQPPKLFLANVGSRSRDRYVTLFALLCALAVLQRWRATPLAPVTNPHTALADWYAAAVSNIAADSVYAAARALARLAPARNATADAERERARAEAEAVAQVLRKHADWTPDMATDFVRELAAATARAQGEAPAAGAPAPAPADPALALTKGVRELLRIVLQNPDSFLTRLLHSLNAAGFSLFVTIRSLANPAAASALMTFHYDTVYEPAAAPDAPPAPASPPMRLVSSLVAALYGGAALVNLYQVVLYANVLWLARALTGTCADLLGVAVDAPLARWRGGASSVAALGAFLAGLPVAVAAAAAGLLLSLVVLPGIALQVLGCVPGFAVLAVTLPLVACAAHGPVLEAAYAALALWLIARVVSEVHIDLFRVAVRAMVFEPDGEALAHGALCVALRVLCTAQDRALLMAAARAARSLGAQRAIAKYDALLGARYGRALGLEAAVAGKGQLSPVRPADVAADAAAAAADGVVRVLSFTPRFVYRRAGASRLAAVLGGVDRAVAVLAARQATPSAADAHEAPAAVRRSTRRPAARAQ